MSSFLQRFKEVSLRNPLTWIIALLFAGLYLTLGYHNRLAAGDDLLFLNALREKGILDSVLEFEFNKRYASFTFYNLIFATNTQLESAHLSLFLYHIGFFTTFVASAFFFLKNVLQTFSLRLTRSQLGSLTIVTMIIVFFSSPQPIDIWFWTLATTLYSVPLLMFFIGGATLFLPNQKWWHYLIVFISFLYIGGSLETFALSVLFLLGLLFIGTYTVFKETSLRSKKGIIILAGISGIILLAINIFDGGVSSRMALEEESVSAQFPGAKAFFSTFIQRRNSFALLGLLIVFMLGQQVGIHQTIPLKSVRKKVYTTLIILLIIGIITVVPLMIVFEGWGSERAWIPFFFFTALSLIFWSFYVGIQFSNVDFEWRKNIPLLLLMAFLAAQLVRQSKSSYVYAKAYDKMTETVMNEKAKGRTEPLMLDPLPDPGMLVRCDITSNPKAFNNQTYKKALDLPFDIQTKE